MEINKGEPNKERGRASKKEICYAHKHGCGVVWCGVVWRERADQFCALHHPTASMDENGTDIYSTVRSTEQI